MKMKYLWYAIVFIVVAVVMYHATYFLLWLSGLTVYVYAPVLAFVFLLVAFLLNTNFKGTDYKPWLNVFLSSWLIGACYALAPSMLKDVRYYEGLITRRNLSSYLFNVTRRGIEIFTLNKDLL